MKLKLIFLLMLMSSKSMSLTLGGVDVGNGHITPSMFETNGFNSEEELISFAEGLLNSLNYGIDPIAVDIATDGDCDLNKFRFNSMKINYFYPPGKRNKFRMKKYKAKILVDFFNCQNPDLIASEIRNLE